VPKINTGDRADPAFQLADLKSPANGIWLCPVCHILVDGPFASTTSAEELRKWKAEAELRATDALSRSEAFLYEESEIETFLYFSQRKYEQLAARGDAESAASTEYNKLLDYRSRTGCSAFENLVSLDPAEAVGRTFEVDVRSIRVGIMTALTYGWTQSPLNEKRRFLVMHAHSKDGRFEFFLVGSPDNYWDPQLLTDVVPPGSTSSTEYVSRLVAHAIYDEAALDPVDIDDGDHAARVSFFANHIEIAERWQPLKLDGAAVLVARLNALLATDDGAKVVGLLVAAATTTAEFRSSK